MSTDPIGDAVGETPTTELVSGTVGGRCANCQAPLASDQRYCLNCGQRRGKARFNAMPAAAPEAAGAGAAPRSPHRPRFSGAATLIAGVGTLLIAMGVGFLIGHDSNGAPAQRASAPIHLSVGGSGTGSSTGASAASTNPAQATRPSAAAKASAKHAPKTVVVHLTPKVETKVSAAASKVFGSSGNLAKNVTQQVGGSCTGGAGSGCQNGKITGNIFSGG
jgi:hypothetical protein